MKYVAAHSLDDGDVVMTDAHPGARFTVVAVHEAKAWIRELSGEREMIVEHHRCAPVSLLS